ncbi:hypothetical protein [Bradyrhizobium sp.]|uniref:hypothetical protein n=1 Tax=Bradyrhizobium sp. TaxID=376 RepID=UPI001DFAED03|nr:hypothetical protein [Bradyrhizobium sp.]MBI5321894.1 hypothetical protein [Bradyrhizobium sp.]
MQRPVVHGAHLLDHIAQAMKKMMEFQARHERKISTHRKSLFPFPQFFGAFGRHEKFFATVILPASHRDIVLSNG